MKIEWMTGHRVFRLPLDDDLVQYHSEGRDPVITGEDALHSLAVIQSIYEAERTGRAIDVPKVGLVV